MAAHPDQDVAASRAASLLTGLRTGLDQLIADTGAGELARLDSAGLMEFIDGFEQLRNRLALVDHEVVAAVEGSTLADELVAGSTVQVLTRVARVSRPEAYRRVHAADALRAQVAMTGAPRPARHPALAAAAQSGRVPVENTQVAVRCLRRLSRTFFATPDQLDVADQELATAAVVFGPEQLRQVAQKLEDVLFPDGCLGSEQEVADARDLTLTAKADGSWWVEGRLTGLCGAALSTVLTSMTAPTPDPDGTPDPRTPGQRRHDALHTATMMLLRTGNLPRTGGIPASIIITIDHPTLLAGVGHGHTADGGTLTAAEIMRLADEAELLPTLITQAFDPGGGSSRRNQRRGESEHEKGDAQGGGSGRGGGGLQLNLGRTRRCATETQTKALIARDGGCSFPSCTAPPAWCDRHHIIPWATGGPTNIDNLTLLCSYHHTYFNQHHWTCTLTNGLPW